MNGKKMLCTLWNTLFDKPSRRSLASLCLLVKAIVIRKSFQKINLHIKNNIMVKAASENIHMPHKSQENTISQFDYYEIHKPGSFSIAAGFSPTLSPVHNT